MRSARTLSVVAESIRTTDNVRADRIRVIPNFVDDDAFVDLTPEDRARRREEFGFPEGAIVVGCVARLVPVKDHKSLLTGFAAVRSKHPGARLLIIGDGESADGLKRLAESLRINDVVAFAGERLEAFNLHQLFDLSVLCSLSEGFPNTLVEAMAAGRATIATRVGGSVDAVDDGRTGILIPPEAPAALAEALDRLIGDRETRERMGVAGREVAQREFSARLVVPAIESLYTQAARRNAA